MLSHVPGASGHSHSRLLFPMMRVRWEGESGGERGAASKQRDGPVGAPLEAGVPRRAPKQGG